MKIQWLMRITHIIALCFTGEVPDVCQEIEIKTEQQIQSIREACKLARQILVKAGEGLRVIYCY